LSRKIAARAIPGESLAVKRQVHLGGLVLPTPNQVHLHLAALNRQHLRDLPRADRVNDRLVVAHRDHRVVIQTRFTQRARGQTCISKTLDRRGGDGGDLRSTSDSSGHSKGSADRVWLDRERVGDSKSRVHCCARKGRCLADEEHRAPSLLACLGLSEVPLFYSLKAQVCEGRNSAEDICRRLHLSVKGRLGVSSSLLLLLTEPLCQLRSNARLFVRCALLLGQHLVVHAL
jgi:hypothetical protein